jgi:hypothetical protein
MSEKGQGEELLEGAGGAGATPQPASGGGSAASPSGGGSQADQSGPPDAASGIGVGGEVGTEVDQDSLPTGSMSDRFDPESPGLPEVPEAPEIPEVPEMPETTPEPPASFDDEATRLEPPPPELADSPGELEQEQARAERAKAAEEARERHDRAYGEAMERRYDREAREAGLDPNAQPPDLEIQEPPKDGQDPVGKYSDDKPVIT